MDMPAAAFSDLAALARLRSMAGQTAPAALREAAGQFEALLVQSMLKSMRAVSFGGGLFDSSTTDMYRDLMDQQLAVQLSRRKGLGLADLIVRQLGGGAAVLPQSPAPLSARVDPWRAGSAREFAERLWPHARDAARKLGVSARAVLAQAALETGWGQRMPHTEGGSPSLNFFGIKAGPRWGGASATVPTLEFDGGVARRELARFRAYASPEASFLDYAALLGGDERYAGVLARGNDVEGFAQALQQAGYATDPDYARKLAEVANGDLMREVLAGMEDQE